MMALKNVTSDSSIIRKVLQGEREAFNELVTRYLPVVHAMACAYTRDPCEADDVAQEAFLKAFRELHTLRNPGKFGAWIASIVRRLAWRSQDVRRRATLREKKAALSQVIRPDVVQDERRALVREKLAELEEEQRVVMMLHYFAGRSTQEIATLLGLRPATVRKRLQRARQALGALLLSDLGEEFETERDTEQRKRSVVAALAVAPGPKQAVAALGFAGTFAGLRMLGGMAAKKTLLSAVIVAGLAGSFFFWVERAPEPTVVEAGQTGESEASSVTGLSQEVQRVPSAFEKQGGGNEEAIHPEPEELPPLKPSSIFGKVLTTAGKPVAGASVSTGGILTFKMNNDPRHRFYLGDGLSVEEFKQSSYYGETTTSPQGTFQLTGLLPASYTLRATPPHYMWNADPVLQPDLRTTVVIREGEDLQNVVLVYDEGLALWGTVTDEAGRPIPDATVRVLQRKNQATYKVEADGAYLADGLAVSQYDVKIRADAPGYMPSTEEHVPLESEVPFTLKPSPRIEGRVIRADTGEAVTEFYWRILDWSSIEHGYLDAAKARPPEGRRIQHPEGRFSIDLERLGDIALVGRGPDGMMGLLKFPDVQPGQTFKDVVLPLELDDTVKVDVTGTVVDPSGAVIAGAWIFVGMPMLNPERYVANSEYELVAKHDIRAESDEHGAFRLTDQTLPIERLSAWHPKYALGWTNEPLTAGGENDVQIVLIKGGAVEGTVTLDGAALTTGEARVNTKDIVQIGKDGTYRSERLSVGSTEVRCLLDLEGGVSANSRYWLRALVDLQDEQTVTVDFDFDGGHDAGLEGIVRYGDVLFPTARIEIWSENPDGLEIHFETKTGEEARYYFEGLPSGELNGLVNGATSDGKGVRYEFSVETQAGQVTPFDINIEPDADPEAIPK
jgi:RNA polymerase sigma factor (sigma-70 family)